MLIVLVKYLCVLVLVCLQTSVLAENCPDVPTVQNFDPTKFMGKWYEIQKYPNVWEAGQKCITATYEMNSNGTINTINTGLLKLINYPIVVRGLAKPNETDMAKLSITFSRFGGLYEGKANLWVLETDYENYALTYACTALPVVPINIENAWIMSRTPTLDPQIIDLLKTRLTAINSPTFLFLTTDQTNCPKDIST